MLNPWSHTLVRMNKKEHGKDEEMPLVNINYMTLFQNIGHVCAPRKSGFLFNCGISDSYTIS